MQQAVERTFLLPSRKERRMPNLHRQRAVQSLDQMRQLAETTRAKTGRELQPEGCDTWAERCHQLAEGQDQVADVMKIGGLTDLTGQLGAEAKTFRHQPRPALNGLD